MSITADIATEDYATARNVAKALADAWKPGDRIETVGMSDLVIHRTIDALRDRARRLAPKVGAEICRADATCERPEGKRTGLAWDCVTESLRLNRVASYREAVRYRDTEAMEYFAADADIPAPPANDVTVAGHWPTPNGGVEYNVVDTTGKRRRLGYFSVDADGNTARVRATNGMTVDNDTADAWRAAVDAYRADVCAQENAADAQNVNATDCPASGGFHRWAGVTAHTSPGGALFTLGGEVKCDHCGSVVRYIDLPDAERFAVLRATAETFPGPMSESMAMWALEARGVTRDQGMRDVMWRALYRGEGTAPAGLFVLTVTYAGHDDQAGPTFTVGANVRTR